MTLRRFFLVLLLALGITLLSVNVYLNGWHTLAWAAGGALVGFAGSTRHRWLWRMRWYRRWYKRRLLKKLPVQDDPDLKEKP